ncbi:hypothetical protein U732_787 [Clostridium argentinense CDC 2741]|uniref:Uncharacterized protein n=1 Tax=Clostridium argentinense CDC 2741 TaxID=1418104 RepID=A0A0C1QVX7_9CLOT|nr:hypothetical protein U732_787 [Clostridium argentinense CDC 2741]
MEINDIGEIIIETERLYIKPWSLDYTDDLYNLMLDKQVHLYTDDTVWTKERTKGYIQFNINRGSLSLKRFLELERFWVCNKIMKLSMIQCGKKKCLKLK